MKKKSAFKRLMSKKATPLLIILIVLMIVTMTISSGVLQGEPIRNMFTKGFMSKVNWLSNFYNLVIQVLMMTGLACILISGNMDLSIAGQATLGSLIFAMLCARTNLPWVISLIITLLIALIFGFINTILVNKLHFPAFIATIGASSVYSGLCNVITEGNTIAIPDGGATAFGAVTLFGVLPITFVIAIVLLVVFELILFKTCFGRGLFMVGGNPFAARLAGIDADRTRMIMFLVNSLLSVLGGIFWSMQLKMAHPTSIISSAPNMTATAAAILGGVSFFGGAGELVGPLIAVVLINVLENMLDILGVGAYWNILAQGVLLLLALIIDWIGVQQKEKAMIRASLAEG